MRGYMARKCDKYFTLEKKLSRFLAMTMSAFKVPEEEQEKIIGSIQGSTSAEYRSRSCASCSVRLRCSLSFP